MTSPAMSSQRSPVESARSDFIKGWSPPPTLDLSEWMDKHFVLSAESSTEPGAWTTLPFQRGIADAMVDPEVETITLQKSSRVGFTKLLCGYLGYRMHLDPCSMLIVQPAQEDAEGFSKDEIAPMLRDTPVLWGLVAPSKSRDSGNRILKKNYPGGTLTIVGAHSGRGFRRLTVEAVIFDEVDAYPPSAGGEGDQIELGKKRAYTAAFPKFIIGSSPKLAGISRVCNSFEESDQRDFIVPCPHCDHGQRLRWGGRDFDYGIKWKGVPPEEAYYLCEHCRKRIQYSRQRAMVDQGVWEAAKPFTGHAGFRIWAAYSPFPAAAWGALAVEFLRVKHDPARLQVFVNTTLGEPWEAPSQTLPKSELMERREPYTLRAKGPDGEPKYFVPKGVLVMTGGVDVHQDRIELQVEGYGLGEECWKLGYQIIDGDPTGDAVWDELWELLCEPRPMERGGEDYIRATCIDAGFLAQRVVEFCRPRWRVRTPDGRRAYVFAIKGSGGTGTLWPREPKRTKRGQALLYTIKVDAAKDILAGRFQRVVEPGPAYTHFPDTDEFGDRYFDQLDSEKAVLGTDSRGFPTRSWVPKREGIRNEAWDTAVYCYAALAGLKSMGLDLEREAKRDEAFEPSPSEGGPPGTGSVAKPRRRRARRKWKPAQL